MMLSEVMGLAGVRPRGDYSNWSPSSSPLTKELDQEDHHKKSVLSKVKDKAKKLKHSLSKKKHSHEDSGTPSSAVTLEDEENDENIPEYLGAPMYESKQAPDACREAIRQEQPRAVPVVSEKHILTNNITGEKESRANDIMNKYKAKKAQMSQNNGNIVEAEKHVVSDDSKTQNIEKSGENTWDKGASVKEYLMQKLEPGEDDRALSQVITEAMSPRKTPGHEMGMVDMVREAVTSLLRNEETTSQPIIVSSSPPIPVSTYPQQVTEEENHGRILQTN